LDQKKITKIQCLVLFIEQVNIVHNYHKQFKTKRIKFTLPKVQNGRHKNHILLAYV